MSRGKRKSTLIQHPVLIAPPEVSVIKTAVCSSSSGRSELTYQLGKDSEDHLYIKIAGNSGNGYFNQEWIGLAGVHSLLSDYKTPFSSHPLRSLFEGQSVNTPHFMAAALLAEGFLIKDPQNSRYFVLGDVEVCMARNLTLLKTAVAKPMAITEALDKPKSRTPTKAKPESEVSPDDESLLETLLQSA